MLTGQFFAGWMLGLIFASLAGTSFAALTPAQVNAALGSPEGLKWSISGPRADAWTVGAPAVLNLKSAVIGESYTLQTTVNGPGVLELTMGGYSNGFPGTIYRDGVQTGYADFYNQPGRVAVAAGSHTIEWRFKRENSNPSGDRLLTFQTARWQPYSVLPVQVAAENGVTLASSSWIGQDQWHHGDGAAAWSGVGYSTMTGSVTGPGILAYQVLGLGGSLSYALDGGSLRSFELTRNVWTRKFFVVEAGNRTPGWTSNGEVAMDEVKLVPEVTLMAAMDFPGNAWSAPASFGQRVFGVEMAEARGGSAVILNNGTSLEGNFAGGEILKIRHRGSSISISGNGPSSYFSEIPNDPANAGTDWRTSVVAISQGAGSRVLTPYRDSEIDVIEVLPPPSSVAAALGLAADRVTEGGSGNWDVLSFPALGKFGAQATVSPAVTEAWFEVAVTGPARVSIDYPLTGQATLKFLLDGRRLWDSSVVTGTGSMTIEVPAGSHALRCLAAANPADTSAVTVSISGLRIEAAAAEISEAVDFAGPWAFSGAWETTAFPAHDRTDALRRKSPAGPAGNGEISNTIGTTVTGPGYFSYWTYLQEGATASVMFSSDVTILETWSLAIPGWYQSQQWIPPGAHSVRVKLTGTEDRLAASAIDGVEFTAAETMSLEAALGAAELSWENDPSASWTGVVKSQELRTVASSPVLRAGESSRIGTTVDGAGALTFTWRRQGRNRIHGEIWIDGVKTGYNLGGYSGEQRVTIEIPAASQIEWVAVTENDGSWLEVENVVWQPWPETSLASALDTPGGRVVWTSSGDVPFTGRPNAGSVDGTAAYTYLEPGQEAVLEGTMEGPGIFDFWLRDSPGGGYFSQNVSWSLTIDGQGLLLSRNSWDPMWITGPGTHRVRLTFKNNTAYRMSGVVDEVTWIPLQAFIHGADWAEHLPDGLNSFPDGGRNNAGGSILRNGPELAWIERTVTGPCVVEWDSRASKGGPDYYMDRMLAVTIDGKCDVSVEPEHGWTRHAFHVPAGEHTIRWTNRPVNPAYVAPPSEGAFTFGAYWQLAGIKVTAGAGDLPQAVDAPGSAWLVMKSDAGGTVTGAAAKDGVDAYMTGFDEAVFYCNLSASRQHLRGAILDLNETEWQQSQKLVAAGESILWGFYSYGLSEEWTTFTIDQFSAGDLAETSLAEGVDCGGDEMPGSGGWAGIISPGEALDGVDCGWSFLNQTYSEQTAALTVTGPARIKFHWKHRGAATTLQLRVNGGLLNVSPPTGDWSDEVVVEVGGLENLIEWVHSGTPATSPEAAGEAWLDGVSVEALPGWSLDQVTGGNFDLETTTENSAGDLWKPIGYRDAAGTTIQAARVVEGGSLLKATIVGPVVVDFQGRCFGADVTTVIPLPVRTRLYAETPGDGTKLLGQELTVRVDGAVVTQVPRSPVDQWSDASFFVPAGSHEVTWQLNDVLSSYFSIRYLRPSTTAGLQGWVDEITTESARRRYERWADAAGLSGDRSGPEQDADGDGVCNLMEYAFGSDPADGTSRPLPMFGKISSDTDRGLIGMSPVEEKHYHDLFVPYVSQFVDGVVESSADLRTWSEMPDKLLNSQPAWNLFSSWPGMPMPSATHQVISSEYTPGQAVRFFRVKVTLPETP